MENNQIAETMRKSILTLLAATLIATACSAGEGWVKVEGTKFVDPQGKELVFRGLCFSDPVKLVRVICSSFTEPVPGRLLAKI